MDSIPLSKLQVGDVILTAHNGLEWSSSLFIKIANFFYRGPIDKDWTHSAIYNGNDEIVEACQNGVQKNNISKYTKGENYQILVLRHKHANGQALQTALKFCNDQVNMRDKYDLRGLAYFVLYNLMPVQMHFILEDDFIGSLFHVRNSYFCSELVSTGFLKAGIYCFEEEPYKVMPVGFHNALLFDEIGTIGTLNKQCGWLVIPYFAVAIFCFLLTIFVGIILLIFYVPPRWIFLRFKKPEGEKMLAAQYIVGQPEPIIRKPMR